MTAYTTTPSSQNSVSSLPRSIARGFKGLCEQVFARDHVEETEPPQTGRVSLLVNFVLPVWGESSERGDQSALFIPADGNAVGHAPCRGKAHRLFGSDAVTHDIRCQKGKLQSLLNTLAGGIFRSRNLIKGLALFDSEGKGSGKIQRRKPTARAKSKDMMGLQVAGKGPTEIAIRLGIGRASVYRILNDTKTNKA